MRYNVGKFIRWDLGRELTEGVLASLHFPQGTTRVFKGLERHCCVCVSKKLLLPRCAGQIGVRVS